MKTLVRTFLIGSLALNAAFAYLLARGTQSRSTHRAEAGLHAGSATAIVPRIDSTVWPALASDRLATEIDRLRASGFPEDVIRTIIAAQIHDEFAGRMEALTAGSANQPYWKRSWARDPKLMAETRELRREEQKALMDLLGPDTAGRRAAQETQRDRLGYLPADKAAAVQQVLGQFAERRSELFATGMFDRVKYAALGAAEHDALASILTPQEMLEYDLRNSGTASSLRFRLAAFNPTEEEFRAIYQLQAAFDQKYNTGGGFPVLSPEARRQRFEDQNALTEQIKAALTPDRAAIYDMATDPNYIQTSRLVARLNLPANTADRLYALQKEYSQKRMDMYRSGPMSAEEMGAAIATMKTEVIGRLTPLLGSSEGVQAYRQYGGSWLRMFDPPKQAPGASPISIIQSGGTGG